MKMNSYKYYQADYKVSGSRDKKEANDSNPNTDLLFLI